MVPCWIMISHSYNSSGVWFPSQILQSLIMAPRTIIHLETTRCSRQSISCDSYRKVTFKSSQGDTPYSKDLFSHCRLVHHYSAVTISAETSTSYRYISRKTYIINSKVYYNLYVLLVSRHWQHYQLRNLIKFHNQETQISVLYWKVEEVS